MLGHLSENNSFKHLQIAACGCYWFSILFWRGFDINYQPHLNTKQGKSLALIPSNETLGIILSHRRTGEMLFFFLKERRGGRAKIARKTFFHKNMLIIRAPINILPLVFTYFIIWLKNKKQPLFRVTDWIGTYWYASNQGKEIHCNWFD